MFAKAILSAALHAVVLGGYFLFFKPRPVPELPTASPEAVEARRPEQRDTKPEERLAGLEEDLEGAAEIQQVDNNDRGQRANTSVQTEDERLISKAQLIEIAQKYLRALKERESVAEAEPAPPELGMTWGRFLIASELHTRPFLSPKRRAEIRRWWDLGVQEALEIVNTVDFNPAQKLVGLRLVAGKMHWDNFYAYSGSLIGFQMQKYGNRDAQTRLFISLLKDSQFQAPRGFTWGIQETRDHLRPVALSDRLTESVPWDEVSGDDEWQVLDLGSGYRDREILFSIYRPELLLWQFLSNERVDTIVDKRFLLLSEPPPPPPPQTVAAAQAANGNPTAEQLSRRENANNQLPPAIPGHPQTQEEANSRGSGPKAGENNGLPEGSAQSRTDQANGEDGENGNPGGGGNRRGRIGGGGADESGSESDPWGNGKNPDGSPRRSRLAGRGRSGGFGNGGTTQGSGPSGNSRGGGAPNGQNERLADSAGNVPSRGYGGYDTLRNFYDNYERRNYTPGQFSSPQIRQILQTTAYGPFPKIESTTLRTNPPEYNFSESDLIWHITGKRWTAEELRNPPPRLLDALRESVRRYPTDPASSPENQDRQRIYLQPRINYTSNGGPILLTEAEYRELPNENKIRIESNEATLKQIGLTISRWYGSTTSYYLDGYIYYPKGVAYVITSDPALYETINSQLGIGRFQQVLNILHSRWQSAVGQLVGENDHIDLFKLLSYPVTYGNMDIVNVANLDKIDETFGEILKINQMLFSPSYVTEYFYHLPNFAEIEMESTLLFRRMIYSYFKFFERIAKNPKALLAGNQNIRGLNMWSSEKFTAFIAMINRLQGSILNYNFVGVHRREIRDILRWLQSANWSCTYGTRWDEFFDTTLEKMDRNPLEAYSGMSTYDLPRLVQPHLHSAVYQAPLPFLNAVVNKNRLLIIKPLPDPDEVVHTVQVPQGRGSGSPDRANNNRFIYPHAENDPLPPEQQRIMIFPEQFWALLSLTESERFLNSPLQAQVAEFLDPFMLDTLLRREQRILGSTEPIFRRDFNTTWTSEMREIDYYSRKGLIRSSNFLAFWSALTPPFGENGDFPFSTYRTLQRRFGGDREEAVDLASYWAGLNTENLVLLRPTILLPKPLQEARLRAAIGMGLDEALEVIKREGFNYRARLYSNSNRSRQQRMPHKEVSTMIEFLGQLLVLPPGKRRDQVISFSELFYYGQPTRIRFGKYQILRPNRNSLVRDTLIQSLWEIIIDTDTFEAWAMRADTSEETTTRITIDQETRDWLASEKTCVPNKFDPQFSAPPIGVSDSGNSAEN